MIIHEEVELQEEIFDFVRSDTYYMQRDDGETMVEDLIIPESHTYIETDRRIFDRDDYELAAKILLGMENDTSLPSPTVEEKAAGYDILTGGAE